MLLVLLLESGWRNPNSPGLSNWHVSLGAWGQNQSGEWPVAKFCWKI